MSRNYAKAQIVVDVVWCAVVPISWPQKRRWRIPTTPAEDFRQTRRLSKRVVWWWI